MSHSLHDGKGRPTIGLLIDYLGGRYQSQVWPGAVDAAEERDANLVIFSGRLLNDPQGYLRQSNAIYELVSEQNLDGLVILSGNLCQYVSQHEFQTFCDKFLPLPIVSVSIKLPDLPVVLVDNERGMRSLLVHLIKDHGYRRIAFICGPEFNEEAQQRLAVYTDELRRHDIPYDPQLVAPGSFGVEAGVNAVRLFFDERHVQPEAIVAANDSVAKGVMRAAQERGLSVPGDIALTGFDDLAESRYASPSLTTVRQPLYEQAYMATMMLMDLIAGKPIPERVELPTQPIVRQSCGCLPHSVQLAGRVELRDKHLQPVVQRRDWFVETMLDAIEESNVNNPNKELLSRWVAQVVDGFLHDLEHDDSNLFLQTLDRILHDPGVQRSDIGRYQDVISIIRTNLLRQSWDEVKKLRLENLFSQARVLINETVERVLAYQLLQLQHSVTVESEIDRSVLTTLDIEDLKKIIPSALPDLGVPGGYIVLSTEEKYNPATLFMAFDQTGLLNDEISTPYDPRQSLVPPELLPQSRRYTYVIEALYFQSQRLGFGLFEMGTRTGGVYSTLRRQLSSALKGALLLQEHKQAQARLQAANKELEVFSYSVSHDLKAPLRAISQLASWIVEDNEPLLDEQGKENLRLLVDRTQHMHHLIDGILAYSRIGRTTEKVSSVDLNWLLPELVKLLEPPLHIRIIAENELPAITGEPTYVHQVFQNLLSNAIRYMDKPEGLVRVKSEEMDGAWLISVADNGPGIEEKYYEKIFQMFQTLGTRRDADSTGIGLALVKRIVDKWGGKIWVESKVGQGSTFFFTIPKTRSEA